MRLFISVKLRSFYDWCWYKLLPSRSFTLKSKRMKIIDFVTTFEIVKATGLQSLVIGII